MEVLEVNMFAHAHVLPKHMCTPIPKHHFFKMMTFNPGFRHAILKFTIIQINISPTLAMFFSVYIWELIWV